MSIKLNIYNFLISQPSITSLVPAENIGWVDVDEETEFPRIVFKKISNVFVQSDNYAINDLVQRWRFYYFSSSKVSLEEIGEALISVLKGLYGTFDTTTVGLISFISQSDIELIDTIYQSYIDFRFYL